VVTSSGTDGGVLVRKLYGHPSESLARDRLKQGFGRKVVPLRGVSSADGGAKERMSRRFPQSGPFVVVVTTNLLQTGMF